MLSFKKETVRNFVGGAAAIGALVVTVAGPRVAVAADGRGLVVDAPAPDPGGPVGDSTHGCDVCFTTHYP